MDIKQKTAVYGASLLLCVVGIFFLIKGIRAQEITFILIALILMAMGGIRFMIMKSIEKEHEEE